MSLRVLFRLQFCIQILHHVAASAADVIKSRHGLLQGFRNWLTKIT
jgi:hypothetical protein